jgi:NAD(P)-dependent dehydrogenase (short-subunit alcohol dehydrogenase family)
VNLKGVFLCLKYEARAMLATGHGAAIVNAGSINSFPGVSCFARYVASKHAVAGLTTNVSAELGPRGIRVNLLCPGIIDTPCSGRISGALPPGGRCQETLEFVSFWR